MIGLRFLFLSKLTSLLLENSLDFLCFLSFLSKFQIINFFSYSCLTILSNAFFVLCFTSNLHWSLFLMQKEILSILWIRRRKFSNFEFLVFHEIVTYWLFLYLVSFPFIFSYFSQKSKTLSFRLILLFICLFQN